MEFLDFEIGDEELDDFTPRIKYCEVPRLLCDGDAVPGTRTWNDLSQVAMLCGLCGRCRVVCSASRVWELLLLTAHLTCAIQCNFYMHVVPIGPPSRVPPLLVPVPVLYRWPLPFPPFPTRGNGEQSTEWQRCNVTMSCNQSHPWVELTQYKESSICVDTARYLLLQAFFPAAP